MSQPTRASMPFPLLRGSPSCALLPLCLLFLTGCQSITSSSAHLRVIALSADAGPLDIRQDGHVLAHSLAYGTVTSYTAVPSVAFTATASPAGSLQTLSSTRAAPKPGGRYTLVINSSLANLQQTLLLDEPPASGPTIRLLHQADHAGPVDIYLVPSGHRLSSTVPLATNLAPGVMTGYLPVPECICAAVILPAGTRPSPALALYAGRQIEYVQAAGRTLILLDASSGFVRSLDALEMLDGEPPS